MLICENCRDNHKLPMSLKRIHGYCELCGTTANCHIRTAADALKAMAAGPAKRPHQVTIYPSVRKYVQSIQTVSKRAHAYARGVIDHREPGEGDEQECIESAWRAGYQAALRDARRVHARSPQALDHWLAPKRGR